MLVRLEVFAYFSYVRAVCYLFHRHYHCFAVLDIFICGIGKYVVRDDLFVTSPDYVKGEHGDQSRAIFACTDIQIQKV